MTTSLKLKYRLVEEGAELENARADGFDREGEGERSGRVNEKDDAVEFAFSGTTGERESDGVKKVAATNIELFFEQGHDFLKAVGVEGSGIEEEKGEFADDVAGGVTGEHCVGFGRLE